MSLLEEVSVPPLKAASHTAGRYDLIGSIEALPERFFEPESSISSRYAESKWAAGRMLEIAASETPLVVQMGQITGERNGYRKVGEWVPSIVECLSSVCPLWNRAFLGFLWRLQRTFTIKNYGVGPAMHSLENSGVCVNCGKLKSDISDPNFVDRIRHIRDPNVWSFRKTKSEADEPKEENEGNDDDAKKGHGGCGAVQPQIRKGTEIVRPI